MSGILSALNHVASSVGKVVDERKRDNNILCEKAGIVNTVAITVLICSIIIAISAVLFSSSLFFIGALIVGYASYEVSVMANNIKDYVENSFFVRWHPELTFAQNLLLDRLHRSARILQIDEVSKNAPLTNFLLKALYG